MGQAVKTKEVNLAMLTRSRSLRGELERMQKEMDRIWDRFSSDMSSSTFEQDWNPSLDLAETEDNLVVELEVPGINPKDISISITGNMLTISGEKKQAADREGKNYHLVERSYGKFSRSIQLPTSVDPDRVEARYNNGILRVTLGKTEGGKSKRIEVKTA
jgi:HSP20 family protein